MSRYFLMNLVQTTLSGRLPGDQFPWGTWIVNVSGSLLIGVLYVLIAEKMPLPPGARALLIVGFLGAFTTFSTFSIDALLLIQQGWLLQATAYIVSSVLVCVLVTWLGMALTRLLA
jgi:fluoride exporter